jgi:2-keto-4-pentenoate hydratase/2-oxohepta-3-ene-1,7-dioic acid hydratase in catechol pathway
MKITRYRDSAGSVGYGAVQEDGSVLALEGDIFGDRTVSDRTVDVAKTLAPIEPPNFFAIGLNYKKHAAEGGRDAPTIPMVFMKGTNTLQNPGDPIVLPTVRASYEVDYECELAVVIGKTCKNVKKEEALDYVLGYTCANDVSARDWQRKWGGGQFCQAKGFDTFCPMGPVLVTADEITAPNDLKIKTILNDETMQDWTTADMVFDVPTLIEFLSGSRTLLPGTVILTGTPHGVGFARKPPVWLKAGDTVTIEIEGIGSLTNPVVNEEA